MQQTLNFFHFDLQFKPLKYILGVKITTSQIYILITFIKVNIDGSLIAMAVKNDHREVKYKA